MTVYEKKTDRKMLVIENKFYQTSFFMEVSFSSWYSSQRLGPKKGTIFTS